MEEDRWCRCIILDRSYVDGSASGRRIGIYG
jgi:hypothetical protein